MEGGVLNGSDEAKWVEAATLDRVPTVDWATPSIRDAIIPLDPKFYHISHIPQLVPKRRSVQEER